MIVISDDYTPTLTVGPSNRYTYMYIKKLTCNYLGISTP